VDSLVTQQFKNTVEILTDPWSVKSAIWKLDLSTLYLIKIRDFPDYKERQYTETIEW